MELTQTQEAFLIDLQNKEMICITMEQLQEMYAKNVSKISVKRDIKKLITNGVIERHILKTCNNGRYITKTIYKIKQNGKI